MLKTLKTPLLFFVIFTLVACNTPADISGHIENEGAFKKIHLIKPESLWDIATPYLGTIIDSATVHPDGSFEFHNLPKFTNPTLLELVLQIPSKAPNYYLTDSINQSNYMPIVWEPGKPIKIEAKSHEFQKSFSIKQPSKTNKALLKLNDISQTAYQKHLATKNWDIYNAHQLMEKEHAILQYQKELIQFADSTQYYLPAIVALRLLSPKRDYERVPEFLVNQCTKWNKKKPNHPWTKQLCITGAPENLPVLIGDKFPNTKLPTINKDTIYLNNHLGRKLTVIDIWASWCGPCRIENRNVLVPLWDEFHNKGLSIIAYGLESDELGWKKAVEHDGANVWLQASDLQGDDAAFLKETRISTIPANFILDSKGIVIAKNIHGKSLTDFVTDYIEHTQQTIEPK